MPPCWLPVSAIYPLVAITKCWWQLTKINTTGSLESKYWIYFLGETNWSAPCYQSLLVTRFFCQQCTAAPPSTDGMGPCGILVSVVSMPKLPTLALLSHTWTWTWAWTWTSRHDKSAQLLSDRASERSTFFAQVLLERILHLVFRIFYGNVKPLL